MNAIQILEAYGLSESGIQPQALWNDQSRRLLDVGHSKGKVVTLETTLEGIAIPLHPGAERYYKEIGVLE